MSLATLVLRDVHVATPVPKAGLIISTILSLFTISIVAIFFSRRLQTVVNWKRVPLTKWLTFLIYLDSIAFTVLSAVLEHGYGLNATLGNCSAAIELCLICYLSSKLIYYFLVEKVYIIRRVSTPRLKSKLYLFNTFGLLLTYVGIIIFNFINRVAVFTPEGVCVIGMKSHAVLPLILYDALVNLYLTLLFVIPLRNLYSYRTQPNSALRTIALRSFFGSVGTLTSSVVNLTVLLVLHGEAAWICLLCCNADVLFSVVVLHWVTSKDRPSTVSTGHSDKPTSKFRSKITGGGQSSRQAQESSTQNGVITTISAVNLKDNTEHDDDSSEMESGDLAERGHGGQSWPMKGIKVRVGQTVEIESRANHENSSDKSSSEDYRKDHF